MTSPPPKLNDDMCDFDYSNDFKDFIDCCLVKDPHHRISAAHALRHPFFRKISAPSLLVDYLSQSDYENRRRRYHRTAISTPSSEEDIYDTWEFPAAIDTSVPRLCVTEHDNDDPNLIDSPSDSPVTPADEQQRPIYGSNVHIKFRADQLIDPYPPFMDGKRH